MFATRADKAETVYITNIITGNGKAKVLIKNQRMINGGGGGGDCYRSCDPFEILLSRVY